MSDQMALTHLQANCLKFIQNYQAENDGASPSYRQMMAAFGLRSHSGISRLMHGLRERGYVDFEGRKWRTVTVNMPKTTNPLQGFTVKELRDELARREIARARDKALSARARLTGN